MTDKLNDSGNPSEEDSASLQRRPRRPFSPRQADKPLRNPGNTDVRKSQSQSGQTQDGRRNNSGTGEQGWVNKNNDGRKPGSGDKKKTYNNTGRPLSSSNRRQSYNPNRRKNYDKRATGEKTTNETIVRPPSIPLKAVGGIKALTENGQFGRNWWARRWINAMEKLMDGRRLSRGQDYASQGQVVSMGEIKNGVAATVQGSRVKPYRVTIQVMPLKAEEWEKALDVLSSQAVFAAKLLAGEMPENIEEAFQSAKLSLFPERPGDLVTQCSCPDWANPCKHVAATHYILGDRFDEDPFLLFRMRGRSKEQVLEGLRLHRGGTVEEAPTAASDVLTQPLDDDLNQFWQTAPILEEFSVQVKAPKVTLPILKRLGQPDIIRTFMVDEELGAAYDAASQAALILAFSDTTGDELVESDTDDEN